MHDNGGMKMPPFFVVPVLLLAVSCSPTPPPAAHATVPAAAPVPKAAMDSAVPMQVADAEVEGGFGSGAPVTVTLHVKDMMGSGAMGPARFQTVHEHKLHVLIA